MYRLLLLPNICDTIPETVLFETINILSISMTDDTGSILQYFYKPKSLIL